MIGKTISRYKTLEKLAEGGMENSGCILCGSCIDGCVQGVIRYSF